MEPEHANHDDAAPDSPDAPAPPDKQSAWISAQELASLRQQLIREGVPTHLVDDALSHAIEATYERLRLEANVSNVVGYLKRVAHNKVIDAQREQQRLRTGHPLTEIEAPPAPVPNFEQEELRNEFQHVLKTKLTSREAWLVYEHCVSERTLADLGTTLGISHQAVSKQLERALKKLREYFAKYE